MVRLWGRGVAVRGCGLKLKGRGESKMLNDMLYIKMAEIKNLVQ